MTDSNVKCGSLRDDVGLVIGDYHAIVGQPQERAKLINAVMREYRPSWVIIMGDWWDMASLCQMSSKTELEGSRIKHDLDVGVIAARIAFGKLGRNSPLKDLIVLRGNHEYRLNKYLSNNPKLGDAFSFPPLLHQTRVIPYMTVGEFRGVAISHNFPAGVSNRPLSSQKNLADVLLDRGYMSSMCGHDHRFHYATRTTWMKKELFAFNTGCFAEDEPPEWAGNAERLWDRGLLLIHGLQNGCIQHYQWLPLNYLRKRYG